MGRCTGRRCPAQVGYDVANCNQFDCIYRTEINTNYDRIKSMSVEEMADIFNYLAESCGDISGTCNGCIMYVKRGMNDNCHKLTCTETIKRWLLQEVSENDR